MIVIAHNIRSLHNVGAIFRSADAFGVERLYLTGYTAVPPRCEIAKTALGSETRVAWEQREDAVGLIRELQGKGMKVVALETGSRAIPITDFQPTQPFALVIGNEVTGIETDVLDAVDAVVEIPMPGAKRSLNVSVAAGIALFALNGKNR